MRHLHSRENITETCLNRQCVLSSFERCGRWHWSVKLIYDIHRLVFSAIIISNKECLSSSNKRTIQPTYNYLHLPDLLNPKKLEQKRNSRLTWCFDHFACGPSGTRKESPAATTIFLGQHLAVAGVNRYPTLWTPRKRWGTPQRVKGPKGSPGFALIRK